MIGLNEPYRICALHDVPAVVLPRLQPEKLLVAFVRAKCLRVVFQFLFLAQDAWGSKIMHLHMKGTLCLYSYTIIFDSSKSYYWFFKDIATCHCEKQDNPHFLFNQISFVPNQVCMG